MRATLSSQQNLLNTKRISFVLTIVGALLGMHWLTGCASNSWEEDYKKISKPIVEQYLQQAQKLTTDVYQYEHQTIQQDQTVSGNPPTPAANQQNQPTAGMDEQMPTMAENEKIKTSINEIPMNYQPWWQKIIVGKMNKNSAPIYETLDGVVLRAIRNSSQIKVFSDLPLIRKTVIEEAKGKFDFHVFARSKYELTDEPVGDDLKTGGEKRFEEHDWVFEAGINKQLKSGGEFEISQQIERLDNNSRYMNPHDQGIAKLALTFKHPLLNRFGYQYNLSQIAVAQIDHKVALEEFTRQVSSHILEVERSYWGLYMERANLAQKKRLVKMAKDVVTELEARRTIDVLATELLQAQAVLAARHADSIRAEQAVRNAEGKLLSLVNDPEFTMDDKFELVTIDPPIMFENFNEVHKAAISALHNRPEIMEAFRQLKAGMVRRSMSQKEQLPVLDLVVEASLKGLRGEYKLNEAMDDQYNPAKPSWSVALMFDYPLGNRIGKARVTRREIEVRQLSRQLQTTIETVLLEVQVAVRELNTTYREMLAKYEAMLASQKQLEATNERRDLLFGGGQMQNVFLQQLLDYQLAVSQSEQSFLTSYVAYNIAHSNLDRAKGILLKVKELRFCEDKDENNIPTLFLLEKESKQSCQEVEWENAVLELEDKKEETTQPANR